jgi:hypothetical protein
VPNQDVEARTVDESAVDERHDDKPSVPSASTGDRSVEFEAIEGVDLAADVEVTNRAEAPDREASTLSERPGLGREGRELHAPRADPGCDRRILRSQFSPLPDSAAGGW